MDSTLMVSVKLVILNALAWAGAIGANLMDWAQSIIGLAALCLAAWASLETVRFTRAKRRKLEQGGKDE